MRSAPSAAADAGGSPPVEVRLAVAGRRANSVTLDEQVAIQTRFDRPGRGHRRPPVRARSRQMSSRHPEDQMYTPTHRPTTLQEETTWVMGASSSTLQLKVRHRLGQVSVTGAVRL